MINYQNTLEETGDRFFLIPLYDQSMFSTISSSNTFSLTSIFAALFKLYGLPNYCVVKLWSLYSLSIIFSVLIPLVHVTSNSTGLTTICPCNQNNAISFFSSSHKTFAWVKSLSFKVNSMFISSDVFFCSSSK